MEFLRFSRGMDTMRREDFAEWLLHYTNEEDNEAYWENMRKRIPAGQVWQQETTQSMWTGFILEAKVVAHLWPSYVGQCLFKSGLVSSNPIIVIELVRHASIVNGLVKCDLKGQLYGLRLALA